MSSPESRPGFDPRDVEFLNPNRRAVTLLRREAKDFGAKLGGELRSADPAKIDALKSGLEGFLLRHAGLKQALEVFYDEFLDRGVVNQSPETEKYLKEMEKDLEDLEQLLQAIAVKLESSSELVGGLTELEQIKADILTSSTIEDLKIASQNLKKQKDLAQRKDAVVRDKMLAEIQSLEGVLSQSCVQKYLSQVSNFLVEVDTAVSEAKLDEIVSRLATYESLIKSEKLVRQDDRDVMNVASEELRQKIQEKRESFSTVEFQQVVRATPELQSVQDYINDAVKKLSTPLTEDELIALGDPVLSHLREARVAKLSLPNAIKPLVERLIVEKLKDIEEAIQQKIELERDRTSRLKKSEQTKFLTDNAKEIGDLGRELARLKAVVTKPGILPGELRRVQVEVDVANSRFNTLSAAAIVAYAEKSLEPMQQDLERIRTVYVEQFERLGKPRNDFEQYLLWKGYPATELIAADISQEKEVWERKKAFFITNVVLDSMRKGNFEKRTSSSIANEKIFVNGNRTLESLVQDAPNEIRGAEREYAEKISIELYAYITLFSGIQNRYELFYESVQSDNQSIDAFVEFYKKQLDFFPFTPEGLDQLPKAVFLDAAGELIEDEETLGTRILEAYANILRRGRAHDVDPSGGVRPIRGNIAWQPKGKFDHPWVQSPTKSGKMLNRVLPTLVVPSPGASIYPYGKAETSDSQKKNFAQVAKEVTPKGLDGKIKAADLKLFGEALAVFANHIAVVAFEAGRQDNQGRRVDSSEYPIDPVVTGVALDSKMYHATPYAYKNLAAGESQNRNIIGFLNKAVEGPFDVLFHDGYTANEWAMMGVKKWVATDSEQGMFRIEDHPSSFERDYKANHVVVGAKLYKSLHKGFGHKLQSLKTNKIEEAGKLTLNAEVISDLSTYLKQITDYYARSLSIASSIDLKDATFIAEKDKRKKRDILLGEASQNFRVVEFVDSLTEESLWIKIEDGKYVRAKAGEIGAVDVGIQDNSITRFFDHFTPNLEQDIPRMVARRGGSKGENLNDASTYGCSYMGQGIDKPNKHGVEHIFIGFSLDPEKMHQKDLQMLYEGKFWNQIVARYIATYSLASMARFLKETPNLGKNDIYALGCCLSEEFNNAFNRGMAGGFFTEFLHALGERAHLEILEQEPTGINEFDLFTYDQMFLLFAAIGIKEKPGEIIHEMTSIAGLFKGGSQGH